MKIVKTDGCTSYSTKIDDRDLEEFSDSEKLELIDKLLIELKKNGLDNTISDLLDKISYDSFEKLNYCDQCHDTVYQTIYNLD